MRVIRQHTTKVRRFVRRTPFEKMSRFGNLSKGLPWRRWADARKSLFLKLMIKKIGILGGGQLGRMLLQAAANYPVQTFVLENDDDCPAAHLVPFVREGRYQRF